MVNTFQSQRESDDSQKKIVVFLGAGASVAEGASVQANLFRDYFIQKKTTRAAIDPHLIKFFKHFWHIDLIAEDPKTVNFPTFEEALGMLELARDRNEAFRGFYSTPNSNQISHTIEDLVFLIAEILHCRLRAGNKFHTQLINNLICRNLIKRITFISLNYDILIDNALTAAHPNVDLDYGIDFTNFNIPSGWCRPRANESVGLYKVHGSLNWLYCPVCKGMHLTPKEKGVLTLISKDRSVKCYSCGGHYGHVLIPPTFFKVMTNPYLVQIWEKTEYALRQCDQVIFCGYSLPDADMHIKYVLKRAQMNRTGNSVLKVSVVNHYGAKSKTEQKQERSRYERLFGKQAVNYTQISFEQFSERPEDLL